MRLAARYVALYVSYLSMQIDGQLNCDQLLDGAVVLWFHLFFGLDIQHCRSSTIETCCRARVYQCIFAVGKLCWLVSHALFLGIATYLALILPGQVYVAKVLGSDLRPFVRDLHFGERTLHSHVLRHEAGALQREHCSWRVLGRPGVQIYTMTMITRFLKWDRV